MPLANQIFHWETSLGTGALSPKDRRDPCLSNIDRCLRTDAHTATQARTDNWRSIAFESNVSARSACRTKTARCTDLHKRTAKAADVSATRDSAGEAKRGMYPSVNCCSQTSG